MIAVVGNKEHKNFIKKLTNFLETNNFEVWTPWKNANTSDISVTKEILDNIEFLIIPINQNDLNNPKIIELYKQAYNKQIPIILILTSLFPKDLATWFFLENNNWINGYDVSFDQTAKALIKLINDLQNEQLNPPITKAEPDLEISQPQTDKQQTKLIGIATIALIIIAVAISYFIIVKKHQPTQQTQEIQNTQTPLQNPISLTNTSTPKSMEELLIGTWKLADYKDDIQRSGEELAFFLQQIARLKKDFEFTFKPDHTFIRKGFSPTPDIGTWQLDPIQKILYISPMNSNSKDMLRITELTDSTFNFEVAVYENNKTNIIKFYLKKAK